MTRAFTPPTRAEYDLLFTQSKGGGLDDIRVFIPPHSRRGGGLFSVLSGFAKRAIPFLMRTVAPEALQMGKGLLTDVLEGKRLRESLRNRGVAAVKGVGERIVRGGRVMKKRKVGVGKKKKKRKPPTRQLKRKTCYKADIFNI